MIRQVPYCVDDHLFANEDTTFEIALDDILANDGEAARDTLTVVNLDVVPEKSELVVKANGSVIPTAKVGDTLQRRTTVRRAGLRAVYFPAAEPLTHLRVRGLAARVNQTIPSPTPPDTAVGVLTCGSTFSDDTTGAVSSVGEASGEHVYYLHVTVATQFTFSTCDDTAFDTKLLLFNAESGVEVAGNDDDCGLQSRITM